MAFNEIPATVGHEIGVAAGEGGWVAAINSGNGGRIGGVAGNGIEGDVGNDSVVVGEVEEVLDDEMVGSASVVVVVVGGGELWAEAVLEKLGCFHC